MLETKSTSEQLGTIEVRTGSRLHFGLTSVGQSSAATCGGLGVMIDEPQTRIVISPSPRQVVSGNARAGKFAEHWRLACRPWQRDLPCLIDVKCQPPPHVGLGSGTQLALAVGYGLDQFFGQSPTNPATLTLRMKRGLRSAIGTYGFFRGGLIVDKRTGDRRKPPELMRRVAIPDEWRLLLVRLKHIKGHSGGAEENAFLKLAESADHHARHLDDVILKRILPAVENRDFDRFSTGIHEFGILTGDYYRDIQGGVYNGRVTESLVQSIRRLGIQGVGQSSWGPVVFAWCRNESQALKLRTDVGRQWQSQSDIWITRVRDRGVSVVRPDT